jgi:hypothetical protein
MKSTTESWNGKRPHPDRIDLQGLVVEEHQGLVHGR